MRSNLCLVLVYMAFSSFSYARFENVIAGKDTPEACAIINGHIECVSIFADSYLFKIPKEEVDFRSVFMGTHSVCGVKSDGTTTCWKGTYPGADTGVLETEKFAKLVDSNTNLSGIVNFGHGFCALAGGKIFCAPGAGFTPLAYISKLKNPRFLSLFGNMPAVLSDEGFSAFLAEGQFQSTHKLTTLTLPNIELNKYSELVAVSFEHDERKIKFCGIKRGQFVCIIQGQEIPILGVRNPRNIHVTSSKVEPEVCVDSDDGELCNRVLSIGQGIPLEVQAQTSIHLDLAEGVYSFSQWINSQWNNSDLRCTVKEKLTCTKDGREVKPIPRVPTDFKSKCSVSLSEVQRGVYAVDLWKKGWAVNDKDALTKVAIIGATKTEVRYNTYPCNMEYSPHKVWCDSKYTLDINSIKVPWFERKKEVCSALTQPAATVCDAGLVYDFVQAVKVCSEVTAGSILVGDNEEHLNTIKVSP